MYFAERSNFIRKGRPNLITGKKFEELIELYYTKSYSIRYLAQIFGVSKTTILRTIRAAPVTQVIE